MFTDSGRVKDAIELAHKLPVFSCKPDKSPATPRGFKDASRDAERIRAMWRYQPEALIGVPTGELSGFDVLDIDPRHGGDGWLAENATRVPETYTHRTRSSGLHLFFQHAERVRNSAARIAPGVDVRGDGGYVIWWPGSGGEVLGDAQPVPWPEWLLALVLAPPAPLLAPLAPAPRVALPADAGQRHRYAEGAIRRAVRAVASAGDGGRNDRLNTETFALARFVREGALTARDVADAMAQAALAAGLAPREVAATIASALEAGRAP